MNILIKENKQKNLEVQLQVFAVPIESSVEVAKSYRTQFRGVAVGDLNGQKKILSTSRFGK